MTFKVKLSCPEALPKIGSEGAAAMDLRNVSHQDFVIHPGETVTISTGVSVALPAGWVGLCLPRSGAGKIKVMLANIAGLIDSDYRGEINIMLYNYGEEPQFIQYLERICQMTILPHYPLGAMEIVDSFDETARGTGKFGSSGKF